MNLGIRFEDFPRKNNEYLRQTYNIGSDISRVSRFRLNKATTVAGNDKVLIRNVSKATLDNFIEEQFLTELFILTKLSHPGIGIACDYFQDSLNYYVILERFSTGNLQDYIISTQEHSESKVAFYMRQIFSFLSFLEINNIAYRALSLESIYFPSNPAEGILKFVDFIYSKVINPGEILTERTGSTFFIAPEIIQRRYDKRADMWSAGVVLYMLLNGHPPFNGATESEVFGKIQLGQFPQQGPIWNSISNEAKDLIVKLLKRNPNERISPSEALNHPWITSASTNIISRDAATALVVNLSNFRSGNSLKRSIFGYISHYFSSLDSTSQLLTLFQNLDVNHNGALSKAEVKDGFVAMFGSRIKNIDAEIDKIFAESDLDNSGDIQYNEFVTAAIGRQKLIARNKLEKVFKSIDINNNGMIDAQELRDALEGFLNKEDSEFWQTAMKEIDSNGDGMVDLKEFIALVLRIS